MEIDNWTYSFPTSELAAQSPHHMFDKDISTAKLRAVSHQLEQRVLPFRANQGNVRKIHDRLSSLQLFCGSLPRSLDFRGARRNQLPFENQPPLPTCLGVGHHNGPSGLINFQKRLDLLRPNGLFYNPSLATCLIALDRRVVWHR